MLIMEIWTLLWLLVCLTIFISILVSDLIFLVFLHDLPRFNVYAFFFFFFFSRHAIGIDLS